MKSTATLTARGYELDLSPASFGDLSRSDGILHDTDALRKRLAQDGYLYLPGFFPREEIQASRMEFLRRLAKFGVFDPEAPLDEAVAGEKISLPPHGSKPFNGLWVQNEPMRKVVFSARLLDFYSRLLGGAIRHYDHIWTRSVPPGLGTPPHCDLVYMGRGTHDVMTAWIPLGNISLEMGGLMLLEKSHLQQEQLRKYLEIDADTYCSNCGSYARKSGALSDNPVTLRENLGGRWLTSAFRMGDLVTFGMKMVHASLDNSTASFRLSTDTRYQLASEPIDPRWVGDDTAEWAVKNRNGKIC